MSFYMTLNKTLKKITTAKSVTEKMYVLKTKKYCLVCYNNKRFSKSKNQTAAVMAKETCPLTIEMD